MKSRILFTCTILLSLPVSLFAQQQFLVQSTSGGDLQGAFEFNGSLASDGTFNFATDGSPLSNPSFSVLSGPLSGTFTMPTSLSDGLFSFGTTGTPLTNPSFDWGTDSSSNLPNQNDQYQVTGGVVTALKYDIFGSSESLTLSLDNTYEIRDGGFSTIGSGNYTIRHEGGGSYALYGGLLEFNNQPNQNDTYTISGGELTRLKYDLFNASGDSLLISSDGTYEVRDSGFTLLESGTYSVTAIPESSSFAFLGLGALGWICYRRRKRCA